LHQRNRSKNLSDIDLSVRAKEKEKTQENPKTSKRGKQAKASPFDLILPIQDRSNPSFPYSIEIYDRVLVKRNYESDGIGAR
jgi:hypothetical protein